MTQALFARFCAYSFACGLTFVFSAGRPSPGGSLASLDSLAAAERRAGELARADPRDARRAGFSPNPTRPSEARETRLDVSPGAAQLERRLAACRKRLATLVENWTAAEECLVRRRDLNHRALDWIYVHGDGPGRFANRVHGWSPSTAREFLAARFELPEDPERRDALETHALERLQATQETMISWYRWRVTRQQEILHARAEARDFSPDDAVWKPGEITSFHSRAGVHGRIILDRATYPELYDESPVKAAGASFLADLLEAAEELGARPLPASGKK